MGNERKHPSVLKDVLNHPLSRRHFLAVAGAAAATTGVASLFTANKEAAALSTPDDLETSPDVAVRYSVCLSCHSKCGIRVRVKNNTVMKIDGNPWHPNNAETGERLDFSAPLEAGKTAPATLCPKGQSGVEVMYNPFRIAGPLKRVGPRGSGQWQSITWNQALDEVAEALRPYYQGHANNIPIHTADGSDALGSIANRVVFAPGRIQHGQKELTDRLFKLGFGTVNYRHDHTSICETSHHVAGMFSTEKFRPDLTEVKYHFKPDMLESSYILWFGTNPLEANFPTQTLAKRVAKGRNAGVKHVIIDPRHSRSCAFAHRWLPVKPRGDVALAMAIARVLIEQGNHDLSFLEAINDAAAKATADWNGTAKAVQYNTTDASWLVAVKADDTSAEHVFYKRAGAYVALDPQTGADFDINRATSASAQWGRLELDGTEPNAVEARTVGLSGVGSHVIDIHGDGSVYLAPVFQLYQAALFAHDVGFYAIGVPSANVHERRVGRV